MAQTTMAFFISRGQDHQMEERVPLEHQISVKESQGQEGG